jgi:hypothetical protein
MPFWADDHSQRRGLKDPKREFRFQVSFQGVTDGARGGTSVLWYAKTVKKPSFTIKEVSHQYINHTFYYPGRTEWNDCTIQLVDPVAPDIAVTFADIISTAGYNPPTTPGDIVTMSKAKAVNSLGRVNIRQFDSNGETVERWTLWNAFITEYTLSDLKYDGDELSTLDLKLRYDWARINTKNDSIATNGTNRNTYWTT